jgi:uncharacterized protein YjbJ (UPF0337 family)
MRLLIRLVILALAGYGAKALYDRYAGAAGQLQQPASEFFDRARSAVGQTAEQVKGSVRSSASDVKDAATDLTHEVKDAAGEAADDATRQMPTSNAAL